MVELCTICKGTGVAYPKHVFNRVDVWRRVDAEKETCWLCGGTKTVNVEPTEKMHIHKYWNQID